MKYDRLRRDAYRALRPARKEQIGNALPSNISEYLTGYKPVGRKMGYIEACKSMKAFS